MAMFEIKKFEVGPIRTNTYLIYGKKSRKAFLIDPASYDEAINDFIRENKLIVKAIINTHGHADHIAGNKKFGYPVMIHEKDASLLNDPMKNLSFFTGTLSLSPAANRLLKDGDIIEEGEIRLEVIHTPGHTPGGISLKGEGVLFSGDTLFFEGIGRSDLPYSDTGALIKAIKERLMPLSEETRIFPGHGPSSTIEHEKKNNPFLS